MALNVFFLLSKIKFDCFLSEAEGLLYPVVDRL